MKYDYVASYCHSLWLFNRNILLNNHTQDTSNIVKVQAIYKYQSGILYLLRHKEVNETRSRLKTFSFVLTLTLVACTALTLGCTEAGNETANDNRQMGTENTDINNITNVKWQWVGLIGTSSANQSFVPNKKGYTLEFLPNGTYLIIDECNSISGNYTLDKNKLIIEPGIIAFICCGSDSLEPRYLSLLDNVTSMKQEDDQLLLSIGNKSEKILFIKAESVQK